MPKVSMIDNVNELSELISPRRDKLLPIYNWHAFKHSYSKDLVNFYINDFGLKRGEWVLDSFCGGGTTLLTCKQAGIHSMGIDVLPFSVFLSKVKTRSYDTVKLKIQWEILRLSKPKEFIGEIPQIEIIPKAFSLPVQRVLLELLMQIDQIPDFRGRDFFKLALFSILESVSYTEKGGGFLRLVDKTVYANKVRKRFLDRAAKMIEDIDVATNYLKGTKTLVNLADCRTLETEREFDAIITSPPYPNRHDYTRIYSLELILGFIRSDSQMKQLRYNSLRSHVEAKTTMPVKGYQIPNMLKRSLARVRNTGTNNARIEEMLEGYFEDMYLCLKRMKKAVKRNGKIGLVVSNVRFSGEPILVDEILSQIGEQAGLKPVKIHIARLRGNSSQQMKTFSRVPTRESVVIWQK